MPERMRRVYVFVRKVNPARVTDRSVDHGDLAVVAVVVHVAYDGNERRKFYALDPPFAQTAGLACAQFAHTADIVVQHADFYAFRRLAR